jgi:2'-5' RNA ligase
MDAVDLRLFLAVSPSRAQRAEIARFSQGLRREHADLSEHLRFVRDGRHHLTLAFLGATPEARLAEVIGITARVARRHVPVRWRLGSLGGFPSSKAARVAWLAVDPDDPLAPAPRLFDALSADLRRSLRAEGLIPSADRPFRLHLTVARARRGRTVALPVATPGAVAATTTRLKLIHSELGPDGPRYATLAALPIGSGA